MYKTQLIFFTLAVTLILNWSAQACQSATSVVNWTKTPTSTHDQDPVMRSPPDKAPSSSRYVFGVLNNDSHHYADEWAHGVRATTFELQWKRYEPQPGVYDTAYIASMKQLLTLLKAQGWYIQLVPGYHYVPDWVFTNYPNMFFVNQYGDSYNPASDPSMRVINAPFNPQARSLIAGYLARIFADLGTGFDSVRVGGSVLGELRYPPPDWNGHSNSYWAFDVHAQNTAESGIPAQVVGWKPGLDANPGSIGRGQLIVNPSFEQTHVYFLSPGWSPDDQVTIQVVPVVGEANSQHALQVTVTAPYRVHQYVRVQPSTQYRFGGRLRSNDGSGWARMFVNQFDASTQPVADAAFGLVETKSTVWTNLSGTLTTSANTQFLKVELDGDRPGNFLFDGLWLKREGETDSQDRDIAVPLAFYDWYLGKLTEYQNWQIAEIRKYYNGQIDVMYAGKGLMSTHATDALTNDLRGDGWSENISALYDATMYDRHVAGLSIMNRIALYETGVEQPPASLANDVSPYPTDWSGSRWIAYLAHGRGLIVWGENSGQNSVAELRLSAQRMRENGFMGLMWGFESELYADPNPNRYASIDDYASIISSYSKSHQTYLPLAIRLGR